MTMAMIVFVYRARRYSGKEVNLLILGFIGTMTIETYSCLED
jgi:hypothetical protein